MDTGNRAGGVDRAAFEPVMPFAAKGIGRVMSYQPRPKPFAWLWGGALVVFIATQSRADCPTDRVQLSGPWGKAQFAVDLALTPEDRARGLMARPTLPRGAGMLFVFSDAAPRSFWMKNTLIPLDILYFDAGGRFVSAAENAVPGDLTSLPSNGPAQFVLEINGGIVAQLGIGLGTVLSHPLVQMGPSTKKCQ